MSLQRDILRQILDLVKHLDLQNNQKCKLSPLQLRTLTYVQEKECTKPTEIANEFNITPATVTAQIDKLVEKGWLKRCTCDNDRRAINITLTQKSKKELEAIIESTVSKYNWIFEALTDKEQKQLLNLFIKIHEYAHNKKKGVKNE